MGNDNNFVNFESINMKRADDIARRYPKREYGVTRAEIVLTNRCQLKCSYCQKQLSTYSNEKNISHEVLLETIEQWLDNGCKFIHFTGGEATLCEHLPDYVELASKKGAEVTLSTNGVNDLIVYENLIRTGVNCFHISLDTNDKEIFDRQVGVEGSFDQVIQTIQLITRMRDIEHYKTRLVLNVCITAATFDQIVDITRFMLSLKPNDIKLIPIAQLKDKWEDYEEKYEKEMRQVLLDMVPEKEGFNMLRSRINSLVKKSFRGYNDKRAVPPCYLSQDERTIDPEGYYYGCYINYREGAEAIGNIKEDSFYQQSEKLRAHMMNFTSSDICQKYCADITVKCNKYIDKKVSEYDRSIYLDMGSSGVTCDGYGNKAYNIERLYEVGLNVPPAVFINSGFLKRIFIDKYAEDYMKLLGGLNEYKRNIGIKHWIMGQKTDDELMDLCTMLVSRYDGKRYAVRSSSNHEDGYSKSCAGMFETILDVEDAETMAEAIKKVYASKYNYMIDNPEELAMGIIIQEQINADYSGVIFTVNPITAEDEIVINYNSGACETVVSGNKVKELVVRKEEAGMKLGELPEDISKQLMDAALKIEKHYGCPMDIEWASNRDRLYILQSRPVTAVEKKEKVTHKNMYIDSLDITQLQKYDLSSIKYSHMKYMEKHYSIRKKALEAGISFPEVGYLFYNIELLNEEEFDRIVPSSFIYKVVSDNEIRTMAKSEVVPYLKTLEADEDNIVRLQKITSTNACGNASVTDDGNVYIEFIPGGFGGFLSGELPFSSYLVRKNSELLHKEEYTYTAKWVFDHEAKKFCRKDCEEFQYSLADTVIKQLIDISYKMKEVFHNPRVEWELEGDKVYLNDISFEGNKINDTDLIRKQLSDGRITGEVRVIDNIDEVKKILHGRSIVAESEFYKAECSDELKEFLKRHDMDENKKYVIVSSTAHPSLSVLLKYSSGYVFEKGGMLSHMGIILREHKIPGVIEEHATSNYVNGMIYQGGNHE